ncbi:MAG TPA: hypothetical protein VF755_14745 [Catenuloplanes sp.]|jgi:type II secretory pathway pseudopilin PulG
MTTPDDRGRDDRQPTDAGITLLEMMLSMGLMSIVMVLFTTGIIQVYRTVASTEVMSSGQSQLDTAFLRLDREVRYAAEITEPGTGPAPGREPRVEFLNTRTGVSVCTQLRLVPGAAGGRLEHRTWTHVPGASARAGLADLTNFATLASEVTSVQPFERVLASDAGLTFQRLRVRLTARSAVHGNDRRTDVTFTALNSSISEGDLDVCGEGRTAQ